MKNIINLIAIFVFIANCSNIKNNMQKENYIEKNKIKEPNREDFLDFMGQGQESLIKIACQNKNHRKEINQIVKSTFLKTYENKAKIFLENEKQLKNKSSFLDKIEYYLSIIKNIYFFKNGNEKYKYNLAKCKVYIEDEDEDEDKYLNLNGNFDEQFTEMTCSIESIRGMLKRLGVKNIPSTIAFLLKYGKQNPVTILSEDKVFSFLVQFVQLFSEHYRAVRLYLEKQFLTGYTAEGFKKIINESFSEDKIKAYHVITDSYKVTEETIKYLIKKDNIEIMFNFLKGDFGWHSFDFKKYDEDNDLVNYYEGGIDSGDSIKLDKLIKNMEIDVPIYFSFKCNYGIPVIDLSNKGIKTKELINGYNPLRIPDNGKYSMLVLTKNNEVKLYLDEKELKKENNRIIEKVSPYLRTGYDQYIEYILLITLYLTFPKYPIYLLLTLFFIKTLHNIYKIFLLK